jgi:hypothetical protein
MRRRLTASDGLALLNRALDFRSDLVRMAEMFFDAGAAEFLGRPLFATSERALDRRGAKPATGRLSGVRLTPAASFVPVPSECCGNRERHQGAADCRE